MATEVIFQKAVDSVGDTLDTRRCKDDLVLVSDDHVAVGPEFRLITEVDRKLHTFGVRAEENSHSFRGGLVVDDRNVNSRHHLEMVRQIVRCGLDGPSTPWCVIGRNRWHHDGATGDATAHENRIGSDVGCEKTCQQPTGSDDEPFFCWE